MAEMRDERILRELLSDLAIESQGEDAAHLEARVLSAWDADRPSETLPATRTISLRRVLAAGGIAAAVVLALLLRAQYLRPASAAPERARVTVDAPSSIVDSTRTPEIGATTRAPAPSREMPAVVRPEARPATVRRAPVTLDFVRLVPISPDEMSGTFQIVRVQLPRASLGALADAAPVTGSDLIQADVLLGEDGMARAIRVASQDSAYPGRNR
jgi:hypothetical protein